MSHISVIITSDNLTSTSDLAINLKSAFDRVRAKLRKKGYSIAAGKPPSHFTQCTYKTSASVGVLMKTEEQTLVPDLIEIVEYFDRTNSQPGRSSITLGLNGDTNYYTANPARLFIHDLRSIHPVHSKLFEQFEHTNSCQSFKF